MGGQAMSSDRVASLLAEAEQKAAGGDDEAPNWMAKAKAMGLVPSDKDDNFYEEGSDAAIEFRMKGPGQELVAGGTMPDEPEEKPVRPEDAIPDLPGNEEARAFL